MRTNKFYYLSLLLCTLALGLTSCEKEEDEDDFDASDLYGYWQTVSASYSLYIDGELTEEEHYEEGDDLMAVYFDKPEYYYHYDMCQYTSSGSVDGIEGRVDMDLSFVEF